MYSQLRLIPTFVRNYWQGHLNYRLASVLWIINGLIIPLVLLSVWLLIQQKQNLALSHNQLITYYVASVLIIRLTQTWVAWSISEIIREGNLSNLLVKPINIWIPEVARDIALKGIRLIFLLPFLLLVAIYFKDSIHITASPSTLVIFTVSLIVGYMINFLLQIIVGMLAFWLEHTDGAQTIYSLVRSLLSGELVPLALMPVTLSKSTSFLPFQYLVSFPAEVAMNLLSQEQIITNFIRASIWLIVLTFTCRWIIKRGMKQYTAIGI